MSIEATNRIAALEAAMAEMLNKLSELAAKVEAMQTPQQSRK